MPLLRPSGGMWAHSYLHRAPLASHHPQIGQCKQRVQLRGVLGKSLVAHLDVTPLSFDDLKRMLDLGPDAAPAIASNMKIVKICV